MSKRSDSWRFLIPVLLLIGVGVRLSGLLGGGGAPTVPARYGHMPGHTQSAWEMRPEPWDERSREFKDLYQKIDAITSGDLERLLPGVKEEINALASSDGSTLLLEAAKKNPDAGVVQALLAAGADPNVFDANNNSVLWNSLRNPNPGMLSILLRGGADPNVTPKGTKETARVLDAVANRIHGDEEQCLAWAKVLLDAGALVNPPPEETHSVNPLFAAVTEPGNVRMVSLLLNAGADVDRRFNGESPLVRAAGHPANLDVVTMLLEASPDSLSRDRTGCLALRKAVLVDFNSDMIQLLTRAGAKMDEDDHDIVFAAIKHKATLEAVEALLAAGASQPDPEVALSQAVASNPHPQITLWLLERFPAPLGTDAISELLSAALIDNANPEVAKVFIDKGADLRMRFPVQNEPMESLLSYAVLNSRAARGMCELLLAHEIGWDDFGSNEYPNPLSMSIEYETFFELAGYMAATGVDVNGQNALGLGPIHYAAATAGQRRVIETPNGLRELNARDIITDADGTIGELTARERLDAGGTLKEAGAVEMIERLLELGADPALRDKHGNSAFVYSLIFGDIWNTERLGSLFIKHGMEIDHRDHKGATPLMNLLLFRKNRSAVIPAAEVLIKLGADIEAVDAQGVTPLMYALLTPYPQREDGKLVEALIDAGAGVNAQDKNGMTPLMAAVCGTPNRDVIKTLLKAGADVGARDVKGGTVLMYLADHGLDIEEIRNTIALLVQAGTAIDTRDDSGLDALDHAVRTGRPDVIHAFALATGRVPDPTGGPVGVVR